MKSEAHIRHKPTSADKYNTILAPDSNTLATLTLDQAYPGSSAAMTRGDYATIQQHGFTQNNWNTITSTLVPPASLAHQPRTFFQQSSYSPSARYSLGGEGVGRPPMTFRHSVDHASVLAPQFLSRVNATTMVVSDSAAEEERSRLRSKDKVSQHLIKKLSKDLQRRQSKHLADLMKHASTKSQVSPRWLTLVELVAAAATGSGKEPTAAVQGHSGSASPETECAADGGSQFPGADPAVADGATGAAGEV